MSSGTPAGRLGGRLTVGVAVVLLAGALAAGACWWWGRSGAPPGPPQVEADDPDVTAAFEAERGRVLLDPQSPAAWGAYGEALMANGYPVDAGPCLARAEQLAPTEPRWPYLRGWGLLPRDRDAGVQALRRAVARSRADDPGGAAIRMRLAETLMATGANEEARDLFHQIIGWDPDNVRAHYGLGMIASALTEVDAAEPHLSRCTDSPFTRKKALAELAALAQRRGDAAAAEDCSRRAGRTPRDLDWADPYLQENARLAIGRQNRFLEGEQLQRAGRLDEAASQFGGLIKDYPNDARSYIKLAMILDQEGKYADAEPVARDAVRLSPEESQGYYWLTVALFHQAEGLGSPPGSRAVELYQEAADRARLATELKPDHAFAHLYRGLSLKALGRLDEAISCLQKAVLYGPESTDPHLHLGEALAENGKRKEGLVELERAADLAGEDDARPRQALQRSRDAPTKPD